MYSNLEVLSTFDSITPHNHKAYWVYAGGQ